MWPLRFAFELPREQRGTLALYRRWQPRPRRRPSRQTDAERRRPRLRDDHRGTPRRDGVPPGFILRFEAGNGEQESRSVR